MHLKVIHRDEQGLLFEDDFSLYPCRHVHYKWRVNGKGPKRAVRIYRGSAADRRLKNLMRDLTAAEKQP